MNIYKEVAKIYAKLTATDQSQTPSLKSLVYNSSIENKKMAMALICGYLQYSTALNALCYRCSVLLNDFPICGDTALLRVLLYEHVVGTGILEHEQYSIYTRFLQQQNNFIMDKWDKLKKKKNAKSNEEMRNAEAVSVSDKLPRWVRVNLIKTTTEQAVSDFKEEGYTLVAQTASNYTEFIALLKNLQSGEFIRDYHFHDVLAFAPGTDLHESKLTQSAHIVLQDKASCIPAHVLDVPKNCQVLDTCAAPGNKTSHVASLTNNDCRIFSFDIDTIRWKTMKTLLESAGVTCSTAVNQDFVRVPLYPRWETRLSAVEYAMVDPSCTGSGMVARVVSDKDKNTDNELRISKLANIQSMILKNAMSCPRVKRVVYSTCSVNTGENEEVVEEMLKKFSHSFHLVKVMPFMDRIENEFDCSKYTLRLNPESDCTIGFFVALFEKNEDLVAEDEAKMKMKRKIKSPTTNASKKPKTEPIIKEINTSAPNIESESETTVPIIIAEIKTNGPNIKAGKKTTGPNIKAGKKNTSPITKAGKKCTSTSPNIKAGKKSTSPNIKAGKKPTNPSIKAGNIKNKKRRR